MCYEWSFTIWRERERAVCVRVRVCMYAVVLLLLLDRFYDTELFSAPQQTDCALVVCDSKSVIIFL